MIVIISWLTIVEKVTFYFATETNQLIKKFKLSFKITYFTVVFIVVVFLFLEDFLVSMLVLGIYTFFLLFVIIYVRNIIFKVVKDFTLTTNSEKYSKVLSTVRYYSKFYLIAYIVYLIFVVIFGTYGTNYSLTVKPGDFNLPRFSYDLLRVGKLFLKFPTVLYVQKVLNNLQK